MFCNAYSGTSRAGALALHSHEFRPLIRGRDQAGPLLTAAATAVRVHANRLHSREVFARDANVLVDELVERFTIYQYGLRGAIETAGPTLSRRGFRRSLGLCAALLAGLAMWPEHREKLARYDVFAPEFPHLCLNGIQRRNNRQMVDLADPVKSLRFASVMSNPIAAGRQRE